MKGRFVKAVDMMTCDIEKIICIVLMASIVVICCIQVINRNLIGAAMPWCDEVARYMFVWLTFVGSSYAVRRGAHIGVEFVKDMCSLRLRRWLVTLSYLLCAMFAIVIVIYCVKLMMIQHVTGQHSAAMGIPMWLPYGAIAFGGLLMLWNLSIKVVLTASHDAQV